MPNCGDSTFTRLHQATLHERPMAQRCKDPAASSSKRLFHAAVGTGHCLKTASGSSRPSWPHLRMRLGPLSKAAKDQRPTGLHKQRAQTPWHGVQQDPLHLLRKGRTRSRASSYPSPRQGTRTDGSHPDRKVDKRRIKNNNNNNQQKSQKLMAALSPLSHLSTLFFMTRAMHGTWFSGLGLIESVVLWTSRNVSPPRHLTKGQNTRYTGCKRTCPVEQAVSCVWPVHEAKRALLNTGGSLELGSLHTRGALLWESISHQPRVLIGYWVNQLSSVKWQGGETFQLVQRTTD